MSLKVIFMGTPGFSVPVLEAIFAAGHEVIAVYSQPPKPAGRGLELTPSPVHARAQALGLPVLTPRTLKDPDVQTAFTAHGADVAVVVAYGLLLPRPVLDAPRHGCLNLHGSLLPRWRGAAPIERAIMAGDTETGVQVMQMESGLDTGPVALTARVEIGQNETAGHLRDRLSVLGAGLMVEALGLLERGQFASTQQAEEGATYARKIEKQETRIDYSLPAAVVHAHIRGLAPSPGAWCEMQIGKRLERVKVLGTEIADGSGEPGLVLDDNLLIACGTGAIRLKLLQKAGSKPLDTVSFQRGAAVPAGARLA